MIQNDIIEHRQIWYRDAMGRFASPGASSTNISAPATVLGVAGGSIGALGGIVGAAVGAAIGATAGAAMGAVTNIEENIDAKQAIRETNAVQKALNPPKMNENQEREYNALMGDRSLHRDMLEQSAEKHSRAVEANGGRELDVVRNANRSTEDRIAYAKFAMDDILNTNALKNARVSRKAKENYAAAYATYSAVQRDPNMNIRSMGDAFMYGETNRYRYVRHNKKEEGGFYMSLTDRLSTLTHSEETFALEVNEYEGLSDEEYGNLESFMAEAEKRYGYPYEVLENKELSYEDKFNRAAQFYADKLKEDGIDVLEDEDAKYGMYALVAEEIEDFSDYEGE